MSTGLLILVNYNQELELRATLESVLQYHGTENTLIVDDGSTDDSPRIAESLGFRVIRHGENRGVGAGIRTGLDFAIQSGKYEFVILMAANGKMRASEIPLVAGPILRGEADYVQGSRYYRDTKDGKKGGSINLTLFRRIAIPIFTLLVSVLLRRRFSDATCGFRAYRLALLRDPAIRIHQEWLNRYELEYYIHYWACRRNYRIAEVPVTMDYSHLGAGRKSKIVPLTGWWSMARPFIYLALGLRK